MTGSRRRPQPTRVASALLLVLAVTTGWALPDPPAARSTSPVAAREQGARIALASDSAAPLEPTVVAGLRALARSDELAVARSDELAPPRPAERPAVRRAAEPAAKPARTSNEQAQPKATKPVPTVYAGRNRFWIPSLKMSYRVHLFECTRKREPDHYMYRWGCAGENNVYILGHASSVMKPLHDLYEAGRLKVGMLAVYADGAGHVTKYRVTEWRVVDPVDSHWAIASQPVPSMTLQTCVGPGGVDRLNVRLVAVD